MIRSFCHVGLKKIVRFDPNLQQFIHQLLNYFRIIINTFEQDGLAAERNAGIS